LQPKRLKCAILPVVLYGFQHWSLILKEECGCRVFEKRALKRVFGLKKEKWKEWGENYIMRSFNGLHYSPNIIRVIK
jgi:hypothetical protein